MTRPRASIAFILVTVMIDSMGIGIVIPVLPLLVRQVTGLPVEQAASWQALLTTTYALAQFFAAPILGGLSDRFGRRVVLLTSVAGLAGCYALLAVAPTLAWFFVARLLAGATAANVSAANAYVADITPPAERARRFGLIGAAFGVAFVIAPAVGGQLGAVDLRLPFVVSAGLGAVNFLYGLFVLPESLPPESRRPFSWRRANPLGSLATLRSDPEIGRLGLVYALYFFGFATMHSMFVLYTNQRLGWGTREVGQALLLAGALQIVVQVALIRRITRALGEWRTALLGLACNAAGFALYGLAARPWILFCGIVVNALGQIAMPAIRSLLSARAGPARQGEIAGVQSGFEALDLVIAPNVAGALFLHVTFVLPGAPMLLPVLTFVGAFLLMASMARNWAGYRARPTLEPRLEHTEA